MKNSLAVCIVLAVILLASTALAATPPATQPVSLFDPARDIHVADVHAGMTGYGLSVFSGTKIEKFDVEVVDVLHNFNPRYDVILIRCKGDFLEHTGAIEGMSGSPIYIYDANHTPKLAGAFAYGWPLSKDPLGGVQPIEYMLRLPVGVQKPEQAAAHNPGGTWSLLDALKFQPQPDPQSNIETMLGSGTVHLEPLKSPLMISGVSAAGLAKIAPLFAGTGLVPMQAGGGSSRSSTEPSPKFEPGSVLAVPLLTGDVDITAVGTCTEVIGDRMYGFGHPFFGEGPITLPMGAGSIATVVANLQSSFKLGFLDKPLGTLTTDQTVGVAGQIGLKAPMIPIDIHVIYDDKSIDTMYHFMGALHPKLTPAIAGAAIQAAITGDKGLPEFNTVDYDMTMDFSDGQTIHAVNTSVTTGSAGADLIDTGEPSNTGPSDMLSDVVIPITEAADNPFQNVSLTALHGTVHVASVARAAEILSVMVSRSKYEPGDTVKAYITYQPFRAGEAQMPVEFQLPRDLPDGTYELEVTDWQHFANDERATSAFKFSAKSADEVFAVLRYMTSIQHNALYLRFFRQSDGVAVGRTALPRLPSSQRQVLMDAGRSDIQAIVSSTVKIVPTDVVMSGQAQFAITIERKNKVETPPTGTAANPSPGAPVPAQSPKPTGKNDEEPKIPGK